MDTNKIKIIRQAEQNAKNILASAEEHINSMIRDAGEEASRIIEDQKKISRENEKKILSEFEEKGNNEATVILSELERELSKINHMADAEEKKAVAFLKDQMKVSYGN